MKKIVFVLATILLFMNCTEAEKSLPTPLYVGTYTNGDSKGIYRLSFDTASGELSGKTLVAEMENPSFLKFSPDNQYLYAVEETDSYNAAGGAVFAFAVEDSTLQLLNTRGTGGAHPCHVAVSENGREVAVSNYTGGNLALFTIDKTGRLNEDKQIIDHQVLDTTKTPHVHMAKFLGTTVFTADLGLGGVKQYTKKDGDYVPATQASLDVTEGAGPRHFVFSKNKKFLYVINELNSTVSTFEVDATGKYTEINTVSTLAEGYKGKNSCADIHLSPDGNFLYGSNRGENTIVIFSVAENTGKLTLVDRASVHGDWPRNFNIDPTGNYLLVANQKSNNISVFKRNVADGTLSFQNEMKMGSPVCLEFLN